MKEKSEFKFSAKKYAIYFSVVLFLTIVFFVFSIIEFYQRYTTNNSYDYIRASLNVLIFWSILFLFLIITIFYILRYKVEVEDDTLLIRLFFKGKNYNLTTLTRYKVSKYGRNIKFIVWFNRKKRTIVTTEKEPLESILKRYVTTL